MTAPPGDDVLAAAINGGGLLRVEASVATADSSLARVVHMVEEAQDRKAHAQRLAERVARPLVPAILVVAAAIAVIGSVLGDPDVWIGRALVVLVAAAPCAFAISVPVTVVTAVGAASRMGVLIKGGAALEALASVQVVALDKTGTLTRNAPSVIASVPAADVDPTELARVAASLELHSDHPLAAPIIAALKPWLEAQLSRIPGKSRPSLAVRRRASSCVSQARAMLRSEKAASAAARSILKVPWRACAQSKAAMAL